MALIVTDIKSMEAETSKNALMKEIEKLTAKDHLVIMSRDENLSIMTVQKLLSLPVRPDIRELREEASDFSVGFEYGMVFEGITGRTDIVKMYHDGKMVYSIDTSKVTKRAKIPGKPQPAKQGTPAKEVKETPSERTFSSEKRGRKKKDPSSISSDILSAIQKAKSFRGVDDTLLPALAEAVKGASDREIGLKLRVQIMTPTDFTPTDEQLSDLATIFDQFCK